MVQPALEYRYNIGTEVPDDAERDRVEKSTLQRV